MAAVTSAIVGSAFVFYALGFVTVNLYLLSYGARDFELAKPVYLPAGVTLAATMAIAFLPILLVRLPWKSFHRWVQWARIPTIIFLSIWFSATLTVYLVEPRFLTAEHGFARWGNFFEGSAIIREQWFFLFWLAIFVWHVTLLLSRLRANPRQSQVVQGIVCILLGICLIMVWGLEVYPDVSPAFGGGRSVCVKLTLRDEGPDRIHGVDGVSLQNRQTEPLGLLDESDENLLLLLDDGDALRIPKKSVLTVRYLSERERAPGLNAKELPACG